MNATYLWQEQNGYKHDSGKCHLQPQRNSPSLSTINVAGSIWYCLFLFRPCSSEEKKIILTESSRYSTHKIERRIDTRHSASKRRMSHFAYTSNRQSSPTFRTV